MERPHSWSTTPTGIYETEGHGFESCRYDGIGPHPRFGAGGTPDSVAIGDLNGDGKPDLAVSNAGSSDVSVLLGTGGGSFGSATNFAAHTQPISVAIGDLNGDGRPDLGGTGDDHLRGNTGSDKLFGQAGADVLLGGTGNDAPSAAGMEMTC